MAEYTQCYSTLLMTVVTTMLLAAVYVTRMSTTVTMATTGNYRAGQLGYRRNTGDSGKSSDGSANGGYQRDGIEPDHHTNPQELTRHSQSSNSSSAEADQYDTMHSDNGTMSCSPQKNIVLLKTHKTGSSTIQNIIYRFGDNHGLNFAVPNGRSNYFGRGNSFLRRYARPLPSGHQYNILANHAVWNRKEFHAMMPLDTVYITILRHPATQYESLYSYYHWTSYLKVPFHEFAEDPLTHYRRLNKTASAPPKHGFRNPSLFDLGMESPDVKAGDDHYEETIFDGMIHSLEGDFHLVLILEYIEESIILLRDLLCWTWDDVVFFRVNARTEAGEGKNLEKSEKTLVDFNKGDWMLYKYFNETLWRKVAEYGVARMQKDKLTLRRKNDAWREFCIAGTKIEHFQRTTKIERFKLTPEAEENTVCKQLVRSALDYLNILNKKIGQLSPITRAVPP